MAKFTVRDAFEDDVPFIVSLFDCAHVAEILNAPTAAMVGASFDDPNSENYIVEADGRPVANLLVGNQEWLFDLRMLAVATPRRGAGTFAIEWALGHAFETCGAHRVFCEVREDNRWMIAVLERLGFTREGTYRDGFRDARTGEYHNLLPYGMLESEYRTRKPQENRP